RLAGVVLRQRLSGLVHRLAGLLQLLLRLVRRQLRRLLVEPLLLLADALQRLLQLLLPLRTRIGVGLLLGLARRLGQLVLLAGQLARRAPRRVIRLGGGALCRLPGVRRLRRLVPAGQLVGQVAQGVGRLPFRPRLLLGPHRLPRPLQRFDGLLLVRLPLVAGAELLRLLGELPLPGQVARRRQLVGLLLRGPLGLGGGLRLATSQPLGTGRR